MADSLTYQVLTETGKRAIVKLTNVSDGTGETNALKVNVANLAWAYSTVTLVANTSAFFRIGETVYAGNVANSATVVDYNPDTNQLLVASIVNAAAFGNNATITGATSNTVRTVTATGFAVAAAYRVAIEGVMWALPAAKSVALLWGSSSANSVAMTLSGAGVMSPATAPNWRVLNDAANPTGNILLSTKGFANLDTYTLILELRKVSGFLEPVKERNPQFGYIGAH
jgi:hypothetical protein